jgi:hypothetical protein
MVVAVHFHAVDKSHRRHNTIAEVALDTEKVERLHIHTDTEQADDEVLSIHLHGGEEESLKEAP